MAFDKLEYSVCEDCLQFIAYGTVADDATPGVCESGIEHELDGKEGHFVCGVAKTENDPDGDGYDEFSWQACELCRSPLGGSRHGVTLLIKRPE